MPRRLPGPLRLVFGDAPRESAPPEAAASPAPVVDFVAYAEDCLLSGRLPMPADRLTDLLNGHERYLLVDVLVERLRDATSLEVHELAVARDEIMVVHATGPRGNPSRRHRTRQHAVAAQLGPYHVRGYLHAAVGLDPIHSLRRRKPMVPMTDAWIEYEAAGTHHKRRVSSLVVNRDLMDWVVEATDESMELPEFPMVVDTSGPLLKDFTGVVKADPVTSLPDADPSPA